MVVGYHYFRKHPYENMPHFLDKVTFRLICLIDAVEVTSTGKPSENAVSPFPYFGSVARLAVLVILTWP